MHINFEKCKRKKTGKSGLSNIEEKAFPDHREGLFCSQSVNGAAEHLAESHVRCITMLLNPDDLLI